MLELTTYAVVFRRGDVESQPTFAVALGCREPLPSGLGS